MTTTLNPRAIARGFFLAASILTLVIVPTGCRFGASSDSHPVGHLAPRTGPDQAVGRGLGEAVALIVEESNADESSRIDARPVTVTHGDTGPDLDGFTFQATRLLSVNRVSALIGAVNQDQLTRVVTAVQANPTVLVTPSGGVIGTPTKLVWPVGLHPAERGKSLAKYAVEHRKIASVAIIVDQSLAVFGATRAGFESEFQHADRKVSAEWTFATPGELTNLTARLTAAAPKAVLFCGRASDLLKLRPALSAECAVLFGGEEEEPTLRQDTSTTGIIHVTAFTTRAMDEKIQSFATSYRNRTGRLPEAIDALSADATRVLFAGGRLAKTFRREFLFKEMPKVELELPTGPFWYTKDNQPRRTAFVVSIRQGETELLKVYSPEKK